LCDRGSALENAKLGECVYEFDRNIVSVYVSERKRDSEKERE
jgi:hypothetical protein